MSTSQKICHQPLQREHGISALIDLFQRSRQLQNRFYHPNNKPVNVSHRQTPETVTSSGSIDKMPLSHFKFLSLPDETRTQIYRLCLQVSRPLNIENKVALLPAGSTKSYAKDVDAIASTLVYSTVPYYREYLAPTLLHVSRRLHEEATPILYSANKFQFSSWALFHVFIKTCGLKATALLQHVQIPFPLDHNLPRERPGHHGNSAWPADAHLTFKLMTKIQVLTLHTPYDLFLGDRKASSPWFDQIPKTWTVKVQAGRIENGPFRGIDDFWVRPARIVKPLTRELEKRGWEVKDFGGYEAKIQWTLWKDTIGPWHLAYNSIFQPSKNVILRRKLSLQKKISFKRRR